ncbi:hypothetical protein ASPZODRAFT_148204 [Penicilliopsis zonata CBS 506.65]|uniref:ER transporter 6TM N-terminal domain-containing protein n=1 Tax=Penicilliopsis zonata CBS 506.65 TaxID=1073090 RepID=A0A1L9SUK4_9EURO|nr:hypothetical protein ASPZODRAFT_148204 [Penicilliopsis zonata CBS 506.65]OJJ50794.1 hypothetical protein ASPZODRAFT_148204 [Penicilliopsis zonata CBS 506.65]
METRGSSSDSVASSGTSLSEEDVKEEQTRKGGALSGLKSGWKKLGLDIPTVLLMMKGGLAPTIAVSIYQTEAISSEYTTVGYLVAIISILGFAIMPRAKFIQMLVLDILFVCLAAAVALLMIYSSVKARDHTSSNSSSVYNSSASAVCGVWLFFQIYVVHSYRAKYPQFQFPVVMYSIFASVSTSFGTEITTMAAGVVFVTKVLKAFLLGLALSAAVSFIVLPNTTRKVVFGQMAGYIGGLRAALKTQAVYFESLEQNDMFGRAETYDETVEKIGKKGKVWSPEAAAVRAAVRNITDLHGKLHGDLTFAKREVAYGRLGPDDLQNTFRHLRRVMIPVLGLSFVVDVFQRLSDINLWNSPAYEGPVQRRTGEMREQAVHEWNAIMRSVHEPFDAVIRLIDEGLQHISYAMTFAKPPKKPAPGNGSSAEADNPDIEASAVSTAPGDPGFAAYFEEKLEEFKEAKLIALRTWCEDRGFRIPADFFDHPSSVSPESFTSTSWFSDGSRSSLFLFLYMEQLLYSTGQVVLDFVRFADDRAASGKLSKKHLIIPGSKRLKKWVRSTFLVEDSHEDDNIGDVHTQSNILQLGEAYRHRKDPEHLPPVTRFQRIGDKIRFIPAFLRSPESAYGFRVACATMTIAIVALLHDTQAFFIKQRLLWAMIMVVLSMSPTSGQSLFSFVLRVLGTTIAMVCSLLVWYIPDEKTPGVIIFLFIFVSIGFYIPIKMFRFRVIGMISIVTTTMIIGYELQVRKIGEQVATSNGQPYYPIYLLAPYRLAAVTGGVAVGFIWTFFPYPISEHSVLRQSLGASLYLLANYYSIIHETVAARMRGDEGDMTLKSSAGRKLEKARNKVFSKQMLMLNGLRTYSGFLKWEVPIGGRFPKKQYDSIILSVENIANYLSLVGYASDTLMRLGNDDENSNSAWVNDFKKLIAHANVTSHQITSLLCLLSASITNRQPLPPYLKTPKPYAFTKRLQELDKDILNLSHIAEPGFAAFAVLQISTRCIVGDMERLLRDVKTLVGELDFSFHAVSTADAYSSRNTSVSGAGPLHPSERDKLD